MTQEELREALQGLEGKARYARKKEWAVCVSSHHKPNGGCADKARAGKTLCERHAAAQARAKATPERRAVSVKSAQTPERRAAKAKYQRTDNGKELQAKSYAKYRRTPHGKAVIAKYARTDKSKATRAAYLRTDNGKESQAKSHTRLCYGDDRIKDFLFSFYGGISPLSGLPLLAPVVDHAHDQGQKVRGLINDLENLRLAWWRKDSLEGAHAAYANLKDKNGVKGQFLIQAVQYLQRTPEQIGVSFTVIGKRSTIKWSKRDLTRLRAENTHNLDQALERMNAVLEFVA